VPLGFAGLIPVLRIKWAELWVEIRRRLRRLRRGPSAAVADEAAAAGDDQEKSQVHLKENEDLDKIELAAGKIG